MWYNTGGQQLISFFLGDRMNTNQQGGHPSKYWLSRIPMLLNFCAQIEGTGVSTKCFRVSKREHYCLSRLYFEMTRLVTKTRLRQLSWKRWRWTAYSKSLEAREAKTFDVYFEDRRNKESVSISQKYRLYRNYIDISAILRVSVTILLNEQFQYF
jgi:hypothetical protein